MTDSNISSETTKSSFKINLKKILLGKFLFKNAAAFLTSGTANERYFKFYGVPEKKMGRIHFSSGYDWFIAHAEKNKSRREGIRKSFGVKENDFVLLYVGRLAKEKLVLSLLHAYNLVNYPNKKLFFVGDGPMRREMDNTIKQYEIKEVYFLGFHPRQNLCNFYTMADTLILPSKDETWGIVVNEAMCFELPIIVSNRVGVAADLVKDNYNGFISKVGDINALSAAIKKIIDMPASERALFGTRSKQMITSWINSSDDVQEVVKILDSLSNKT